MLFYLEINCSVVVFKIIECVEKELKVNIINLIYILYNLYIFLYILFVW